MKSSNIAAVDYDPRAKTLTVQFKSGGLFKYSDVPRDKYDSLLKADSVGKFFHGHIRGNHKGVAA